ncbi:MAG: AsmA family protein [Proteobacteria bacterium]|nr:MAG: AsmA family protein [Pseudomonadota bacterium]
MKKILWIIGGFLVVFLVAAIAIPLFVSVDRYRPEIQAEANKRINGKLELGKLSLSLWGKVRIHAESIRVTVNGFPQALLDTKDFHVELPISSLIAGKPQVIAVLDSPRIEVIKELDGRMNVMELMKVPGREGCATGASLPSQSTAAVATASPVEAKDSVSSAAAAPDLAKKNERVTSLPKEVKKAPKVTKGAAAPALAPAEPAPVVAPSPPVAASPTPAPCPPAAVPGETGEPMRVPSLLAGATLGLRLEKGDVVYLDKVAKSDYRVSGLDIDARNIGMGSTMDLKIKAPLKGSMPLLNFDGPVEATAQITPVLVGTSVKAARGDFYIDASPLKLEIPGKFKKPAGMPLVLKGKLGGNEKETLIETMELSFHDFKFFAKGRVALQPLTAHIDFSADPIKLEKAREFVPLMAEYDVKGIATFNAKVQLDPSDLKITGGIRVADGSLFPKAYLKAPLLFTAQAAFSENSVSVTRATFTGPESDLQVVGNVKNFLSPVFALNVTGNSLNVDKTLVLPGAAPAVGKDGKPVPGAAAAKPDPTKPDVNPMAEFAKNPMFAKAEGAIAADIGKVTVYGSVLEKVSARAGLKDMNLRLNDATLRTYGGNVRTEGNFNLGASTLPFTSQGNVAGISGAEAFRTYFPKFQNTVAGTVNAQWNVNGGLYPAATRLRSLGGSAKLLATDGVLKSVDVQSTINQVMKKVPFLKDRQPLEIDDGFKTLSAEVRFNGGEVRVDPIEVQPRNKGFVLKGKSTIQENLSQETFLDVYDPQGRLPRDIQRPGKPAIALRLTGPLAGPTPDYEYTVKKLATNGAQNALKNVAGKALDKFLGSPKEGEKGNALQDAARKLKEKFKLKL